jgi:hypothetical protein
LDPMKPAAPVTRIFRIPRLGEFPMEVQDNSGADMKHVLQD